MPDRTTLLARIAADPALVALLAESRARDAALVIPDPTHDTAHALRVARWTVRAGPCLDSRRATRWRRWT